MAFSFFAFFLFDQLADEDVGAVARDGELGDPVAFAVGQAGQRCGEVFGAGGVGDDVGFSGLQVAVIDRDFPVFVVAAGGEERGRAEDQVVAVGGEVAGRCSRRVWRGAGSSEPAMPWTSSPPGRCGRECRWSRRQSRGHRFRGRRRRRWKGRRLLRAGSRRRGSCRRRRGRWRGCRRIRCSSLRCRGWRYRGRGRGRWGGRCRGCRPSGRRRGRGHWLPGSRRRGSGRGPGWTRRHSRRR